VHQVGHYPELHQDARSTKHNSVLRSFRLEETRAIAELTAHVFVLYFHGRINFVRRMRKTGGLKYQEWRIDLFFYW
jgi:phage replication-related protein YjqB (UPF0714/DUF867 family)